MSSTEVAVRSQSAIDAMNAVNAELTRQLQGVPEGEDDGGAGIFLQLLQAKTWAELDDPWSAAGLAKYVGQTILVRELHRMPSDIADGPGWYLVAKGVNTGTGEVATITTSSTAVMCQLLTGYINGWFPMTVIPRVAERKTKSGYYPQHLEIVDGYTPEPTGFRG